MKSETTYECRIYLGLKEGYEGKEHSLEEVENYLQTYCNQYGFAFTLSPTVFIYTGGRENGCVVGIINYPRFPQTQDVLKAVAMQTAENLMKITKQIRCSIVCTDETIMLEAK